MDKKCEELVNNKLRSRIEDLRLAYAGQLAGYDADTEYQGVEGAEDEEAQICRICKVKHLSFDRNTFICEDCFNKLDDIGPLSEYGICFDYVEPDTFDDQKEGYYRWQISCGGPSDEFRFYANIDRSVHRVEYCYLDWFDGATRTLKGDNLELLEEIYEYFREYV